MDIRFEKRSELKAKPTDETKLGFGRIFSDYMFMMNYTEGTGWHDARIVPYGDISISPAATVLHYSQECFEGMKAYRDADGGISLFRPTDNFKRMNNSADRLCMPRLDIDEVMEALIKLVKLEQDWVPKTRGTSLYIRPNYIGIDPFVGVSAAKEYLFYIIVGPVGAYYASGLAPVKIYVEESYRRAVKGGTGFAKTGGNYAASLIAGEEAHNRGFSQALWLDGREGKYIEEVGSMNMFFKIDGVLVTPELGGSILPGITRDSVIKLAKDMGVKVEERKISLDEVLEALEAGKMDEAFGTGTAAVISPVGELYFGEKRHLINGGEMGEFSSKLYDTITGIQYGEIEDPYGWRVKL